MIATLTMELEVPEGVFFSFQKSSLLQGVLMEHISPEYALKLHENGLKPYSQSVIVKKGKTAFCAAERPPVRLPAATQRCQRPGLIDHFMFNHNIIMLCHSLKQRVG